MPMIKLSKITTEIRGKKYSLLHCLLCSTTHVPNTAPLFSLFHNMWILIHWEQKRRCITFAITVIHSNRRFDPSTLAQYPDQSTIFWARALVVSARSVTSGSAIIFMFTVLHHILQLSELWALQWKVKRMLKFVSLTNESLIGDFSWDQLKSINGGLTTGFLESVNAVGDIGS